tara:strand:+ start:168 stop:620 length:453 start_codon:yes stop_codon:yes gene_type:complete
MTSDKLFELVYCSKAKPNLQSKDIESILNSSSKFNREHNITGCLLYYGGEFAQILEGEEAAVLELYERIKRDPRHSFVLLLDTCRTTSRKFEQWGMAFQNLDELTDAEANTNKITADLDRFANLKGESTRLTELFSDVSELILTGGIIKR